MKRVVQYFNNFLKIFYFYLAAVSLITFSLFICEEAIQGLMFANFSCSDTYRYDLIKKNIEKMKEINHHLKKMNIILQFLQPFQWWAYKDFGEATDRYIESLQAEVLANDPGLYINRIVTIQFYWRKCTEENGKFLLRNGKMSVWVKEKPIEKTIIVTGVMTKNKRGYLLK